MLDVLQALTRIRSEQLHRVKQLTLDLQRPYQTECEPLPVTAMKRQPCLYSTFPEVADRAWHARAIQRSIERSSMLITLRVIIPVGNVLKVKLACFTSMRRLISTTNVCFPCARNKSCMGNVTIENELSRSSL